MKKAMVIGCSVFLFFCVVAVAFAGNYTGKKILFIDSYHAGYAWSDEIERGVRMGLEGTGVELMVVRMDTKRNPGDEFLVEAGEAVRVAIEAFEPDVVIAADDNATKAVILPFYRDSSLPFVFCGINWDADVYGFPTETITGMVEVGPIKELIEHLRHFADGDRLGYIGTDAETNHKELEAYRSILGLHFEEYYFTGDVEDFKQKFLDLQAKVDLIIFDTDGGLYDHASDELPVFFAANTTVPTGTCYDFMAPYVLLAFAKVGEEQGLWSAQTALKILDGTPPSEIPVVTNQEFNIMVNTIIAAQLGVEIPSDMLELASRIIE